MKYAIATLGCKVNSYESNVIKDLLNKKGYLEVSFNDAADIYIINTCTVTNSADSKSFKLIRQAIKKNEEAIIVAVGCLVQAASDAISDIEGVDIIIGNKNKTKIVEYIESYIENKKRILDINDICDIDFEKMKIDNSNRTRAFIKIQDGCNNYCSYCIIPYVRGNVRSKKKEDVITEINELVKEGHREFVLTGIHTGAYGSDINYNFSKLVKDIIEINGVERLRISSIEATEIDEDLLDLIGKNRILADHMHIPIQSGSDKILKLMNRKYTLDEFKLKIKQLREKNNNMLITTDLIVGFPGETEEDFSETINTIEELIFHKIHVFPYSKRNGTVASDMEGHLTGDIKKERVKKILRLSKTRELEDMINLVNKNLEVIIESEKEGYLYGHSSNYIPIKLIGDQSFIGKNVKVKVTKVEYPNCIAEII